MLKFKIAYHLENDTRMHYVTIIAYNLYEAKERLMRNQGSVIYIIDELCEELVEVNS